MNLGGRFIMGIFDRLNEENTKHREEEKQTLMMMSEKELMIEILLELKKLNKQSKKIARNQVVWSD